MTMWQIQGNAMYHHVWYIGWAGTLVAIILLIIVAAILVFGGKWRLLCAAVLSATGIAFVTFLWVRDWKMKEYAVWALTTDLSGFASLGRLAWIPGLAAWL